MSRRLVPAPASWRLVLDPIRCTAHGVCAELLPESIDLDEWGYPIITGPVHPIDVDEARSAVAACPTLALRLTRVTTPRQGTRPRPGPATPA